MELHDMVGVVAIAMSTGLGGFAFGMWQGAQKQIQILQRLLDHGTAAEHPAGRTIVPETAEMRIDASAAQVEQAYTEATITQGMAHLKALCVSDGVEVPSDKDLRAEVMSMLGRSGTAEAGVNA